MSRFGTGPHGGRGTNNCVPNYECLSDILAHRDEIDATHNRHISFVAFTLIACIIFLGFAAMVSAAQSSAMDRCQQSASFDTCFTTLNR
ncbi:hypothetical protein IB60_16490 [Brucella abortus LMN1]|uniref:hypothetical protein n=1 Tax=Brucella TaxID=234 RepID=UPI0004E8D0BB|nr:hypothetical protein [Brucella abortus]KFH18586.1 hypothetical protein IB60_16490 [Brucella abortus LMN1]KFH24251.1 hypothetical protein IB61_11290 [Brucella abortus LMN2]RUQ67051.1 hypothetical protein ELZ23_15895 [Brucella abortus]RUQ78108.1 hypothetical protein ELZ22_17445 [Brucella abortus]RUQ88154.1 hypothetical protein ELZ18_15970 [Brucella abortus]